MTTPILTPVLVGLPGAGKSTLAAAVAGLLGRTVFHSDNFFRECRALPSSTSDPRRMIFDRFLDRVEKYHPDAMGHVREDASSQDEEGRCLLHDGKQFRTRHGEDVFRAFEIEMLAWVEAAGLLRGKVPDLSASAPLFQENRDRFSTDRGYLPILLDVPHRLIVARILADYEAYAQRRLVGGGSGIRGQYEAALDKAVQDDTDGAARAGSLWREAAKLTDRAVTERLDAYRAYAATAFSPDPLLSPRENALQLLQLLIRWPRS